MNFWEYLDAHPGIGISLTVFLGILVGFVSARIVRNPRRCTHATCIVAHGAHEKFELFPRYQAAFQDDIARIFAELDEMRAKEVQNQYRERMKEEEEGSRPTEPPL